MCPAGPGTVSRLAARRDPRRGDGPAGSVHQSAGAAHTPRTGQLGARHVDRRKPGHWLRRLRLPRAAYRADGRPCRQPPPPLSCLICRPERRLGRTERRLSRTERHLRTGRPLSRTERNIRIERHLSRTERNIRTERNVSRTERHLSRTERRLSRTEKRLRTESRLYKQDQEANKGGTSAAPGDLPCAGWGIR